MHLYTTDLSKIFLRFGNFGGSGDTTDLDNVLFTTLFVVISIWNSSWIISAYVYYRSVDKS